MKELGKMMFKKLISLALLFLIYVNLDAQVVPNVKGSDCHGVKHDMYEYLSEGKHVVLYWTGSN